jgi:hypothetical protein
LQLCCIVAWTQACADAAFALCPIYNNAFHFVTGRTLDNSAVLDGFTITAGIADGNSYDFDCDVFGSSCDPTSSYQFQGGGIIVRADSLEETGPGPIIAR